MTVFGRLLMTGATVVVMVECGDKMLKQDEVVWGFTLFGYIGRQLHSMALERARPVES